MTPTTNLGLAKPDDGNVNWGADLRGNFDKLDASAVRGASFFIPGTVTTGAYQGAFVAPSNLRLLTVRAAAGTAPTTDLIVNIRVNGTSIWTDPARQLKIAVGAASGQAAPDVTTINAGDVVSLDVDQAGGANVSITLSVVGV